MGKDFFDRNPGHKQLRDEISDALKLNDKDFYELIYGCCLNDDFIPIPEEIVINGHKMSKSEYTKHVNEWLRMRDG